MLMFSNRWDYRFLLIPVRRGTCSSAPDLRSFSPPLITQL